MRVIIKSEASIYVSKISKTHQYLKKLSKQSANQSQKIIKTLKTRRVMKNIIVILERSEDNYSAYIPDLDGCVATGETLDQVKERIEEAVEFHLDGMKEEGLDIPEALQNDYNFVYKIDVESLFEWFSGVLTKSGLAKLTGMNQSLLSQYANGIKKPSNKQSKKIEEAIHNFGEELLSIQF